MPAFYMTFGMLQAASAACIRSVSDTAVQGSDHFWYSLNDITLYLTSMTALTQHQDSGVFVIANVIGP